MSITEEFLVRNKHLNKESLLNFVSFSDHVIEAHYRQVTEHTGTSSIRSGRQSSNQANRRSVSKGPATQPVLIDDQESELFLNLNSDIEDSLEEEDESESVDLPLVGHLSEMLSSSGNASNRKRSNSTSRVSFRKHKASGPATKRRG